MRFYQHCIISGVVSSLFYILSKNLPAALLSFCSGTLIDIDHFPDYFIKVKWKLKNFKIQDFFHSYRWEPQPRYYLVLHSFEWSLIITLVTFFMGYPVYALAVLLGYFLHLLLDTFSNGGHPLGYFFFFRWYKKFRIY